jgi:hypothetical protein
MRRQRAGLGFHHWLSRLMSVRRSAAALAIAFGVVTEGVQSMLERRQ